MNNQKYKFTGRHVPINPEEVLAYVYEQLAQYDKGEITNNPYTEPIPYKTKYSKMIQVPENIQQSAINKWNEKKKSVIHKPKRPKEKIKIKKNTWLYYLCILIAVIIAYFAVKK